MCIRDRVQEVGAEPDVDAGVIEHAFEPRRVAVGGQSLVGCLLYTSDAADERSSVDLGGRRIIKKKKW